jgi:hypothetical protein
MTSDSTQAKTGRSIKNRASMAPPPISEG